MGTPQNLNGRDSILAQWATLPYDRKVEVAKAFENKDRNKAATLLGATNLQISNNEAEKLGRDMMIQLRSEAEKPVTAAVVDNESEKTARIVQAAMAGFAQVMMAGGAPTAATTPTARPAPQQYDGPARPSKISLALKAAAPSAVKSFVTLLLAVFVLCGYLIYTEKATFDSSLVTAGEKIVKERMVVFALLVSGLGVLVHFYSPIWFATRHVGGVTIGWSLFYLLALVEIVMVPVVLLPLFVAQGVRLCKLAVGNVSNAATGDFAHVKAASRWKPLAKSITRLAPTIPVALEVGEVRV